MYDKAPEELKASLDSLKQRYKDVFEQDLNLRSVDEFVKDIVKKREIEMISAQFATLTTSSMKALLRIIRELENEKLGKKK